MVHDLFFTSPLRGEVGRRPGEGFSAATGLALAAGSKPSLEARHGTP